MALGGDTMAYWKQYQAVYFHVMIIISCSHIELLPVGPILMEIVEHLAALQASGDIKPRTQPYKGTSQSWDYPFLQQ